MWSTVCFRSIALHLGWYAEKHSSTLAPHHRGVQVFCVGLDVGRRVGGAGGRRRLRAHVTHFFGHMSHTCPPPHATIVRFNSSNRVDDCLSPTAGGPQAVPHSRKCGGAQVVRHEVHTRCSNFHDASVSSHLLHHRNSCIYKLLPRARVLRIAPTL